MEKRCVCPARPSCLPVVLYESWNQQQPSLKSSRRVITPGQHLNISLPVVSLSLPPPAPDLIPILRWRLRTTSTSSTSAASTPSACCLWRTGRWVSAACPPTLISSSLPAALQNPLWRHWTSAVSSYFLDLFVFCFGCPPWIGDSWRRYFVINWLWHYYCIECCRIAVQLGICPVDLTRNGGPHFHPLPCRWSQFDPYVIISGHCLQDSGWTTTNAGIKCFIAATRFHTL